MNAAGDPSAEAERLLKRDAEWAALNFNCTFKVERSAFASTIALCRSILSLARAVIPTATAAGWGAPRSGI